MQASGKQQKYSWLFFYPSRAWRVSLLTALLVIGLAIVGYMLYNRVSNDISPDSLGGYTYATIGSIFLVMAALCYSLYKRSHKRGVSKLNGALQWHVSFAVIGTVLIFLHSFGNFNPRTGTYALYGMIALVISGAIGRLLDRILPRLMALEVRKALTENGEDRIESISQNLQSIATYNAQEVRSFRPDTAQAPKPLQALQTRSDSQGSQALPTSWDLAYISLEETPQELKRDNVQYRFVPDRQSSLAQPGALLPGVQEHISELDAVRKALQREQFYRYIIRFWRMFHVLLTVVFIGLTLWHLEYAAQLLIPTFFHH